ncbi:phosphotriesterase [Streptomyces sp. NPDC048282]|uniref:phosphotriesterase family protein n=1 Tax=Streptomyces sp. NPDC048282 TaxID=3365528 RepID=UPI0037129C70
MPVQTVLGPVEPSALGRTMTHEHLLCTNPKPTHPVPWSSPPATEAALSTQPITLENCYEVRTNPMLFPQTLDLQSMEDAVHEVTRFRLAGGGTIVEVTPIEGGRDPEGLRRLSLATGVLIVMGTAYYLSDFHPPELEERGEDDICADFVADITTGIGGVKAGIIGEIGLSWPVAPREAKVLRAAVRAQGLTGAPLMVHLGRHRDAPADVIRRVVEAGGDPARTVLCHLDRTLSSFADFRELARSGCYLEFDLFGIEGRYPFEAEVDLPNDALRIRYIADLAEAGHLGQILVSHDIFHQGRLGKYGGESYAHILERVVPMMRVRGHSEADIDAILVDNPARMLTFAEPSAP